MAGELFSFVPFVACDAADDFSPFSDDDGTEDAVVDDEDDGTAEAVVDDETLSFFFAVFADPTVAVAVGSFGDGGSSDGAPNDIMDAGDGCDSSLLASVCARTLTFRFRHISIC